MGQRLLPTICAILILAAGCAAPGGSAGDGSLRLIPLSTRAELVTAGDILLRVDGVGAGEEGTLRFSVNGEEAEAEVGRNEAGEMIARITNLSMGANRVEASVGDRSTALGLTSYPITGPLISGPQEQPFVCQTQEFRLVTGETAGRPLDDDCSISRRRDYVYLSSETGDFKTYESPSGGYPSDLAMTTTMDGRRVPFIVLVETGTINRAVYESAMLHDPADPAPDPWHRSQGWNGKLVYTHGGGCRSGWFQQGTQTGGVLNEGLLGMGYAVTSSTLNVFGQNCSDLIASETHIMVKERFVEAYGEPVYTISTGASGGSYQSHQTADNYPGVFDGLIVGASFPDVTSATIFTLADSRLLHRYFTETAPGRLTKEQQRKISGFGSHGSIANLSAGAARIDPTFEPGKSDELQGGEVSIEALEAQRYTPANRDGIRATVYDHTVNVYGTDPETGFALRPLDNVGVQYGLAALNDGSISKADFIDLNRRIGGFDRDLNPTAARHSADPLAARRAAETGRILFGGAGLASTPILDYRSYTDHREGGDIHMIVHQFSTRARLVAANGHADNHVMAVGGQWGFTEDRPDMGRLFEQMDRWLMAIRADDSGGSLAEKVVRDRPSDIVDSCWDEERGGWNPVRQSLAYEGGSRCAEIYPAYSTPRQVAGAPLANDVVTCQLKPVSASDYGVEFTAAELSELRQIFPGGICDWSKPDAHSRGYAGTWRSFGPAALNRVE